MRPFFRNILAVGIAVFGVNGVWAALELDACYGDHMVLQHGRPVVISGTSDSAKAIQVEFAGQKVTAKRKGKQWRVSLKPLQPSAEGRELRVKQGTDEVTLQDVVVGEVWIASGQSNMLWRVNQTPGNQQTIAGE